MGKNTAGLHISGKKDQAQLSPATGRGERGGSGYAHVAVFYGSGDDVVQNLNMGKVFVITGPYGGYPGSSSYALLGRGVKFDEIMANKLVCPP